MRKIERNSSMKTILLVVGRTVEPHFITAIADYVQRLKRYTSFEMEVIPELKNTKSLSEEVQKEKENKKPDETLNSSGKKTTNEGKSSKTQTPSGKKTTDEGKDCKVATPPEKKKTSSKKKKKNTPK